MKIRDFYKKASEIFAEYRRELCLYAFALIVIFTVSFAISQLFGLWFILIILLLFPIQFGLNYVGKKTSEHIALETSDLYHGFKNMTGSMLFGSKTGIRGAGFGFLGSLITLTVCATIIVALLGKLEPAVLDEIWNAAGTAEDVWTIFTSVDWVVELLLISYALAAAVFIIIFAIVGAPANLATYICLDMPFDPDSGVRISRRIVRKHRKQYLQINLTFALFVFLAILAGGGFYFLAYGTIFTNVYAVYVLTGLITAIPIVFLDIYYMLVKYQYYFAYGKPELTIVLAELKKAQEEFAAARDAFKEKEDNEPKNDDSEKS